MTEKKKVELSPEEEKENSRAVVAHLIPFAIWLTALKIGDPGPINYMIRTLSGIVLLAWLRPWRWYPRLKLKNIPAAMGVGLFIFVVWVGFETPWMVEHAPKVTEWYQRLFVDYLQPFKVRELFDMGNGVMVPFEVDDITGLHVHDPRNTGWVMFWIHMLGTSVIIAIIEEMVYRGFLYRWMQGSPFYKINPHILKWGLLVGISAFFAVSHIEWMAAIICGICYGLLYIKTGDIWAATIAHGVTNFLLGLYVIHYGAYQFW